MIYLSTEGFTTVETLFVFPVRCEDDELSLYSRLVELGVFDTSYIFMSHKSWNGTPSEMRLFSELRAWLDYQRTEKFPSRPLVLINFNNSSCVTLLDFDCYRS